MGFGSSQDKNNVWWWFLKCLQQGVGGFFGEHMDFIYNIDFITGLVRRIVDPVTKVSDFVNATVAGSINFYDIQSPALAYCLAHRASITRFTLAIGQAIYCLSQDAASGGLACSSWTTKKVGVRYTITIESIT